MRISVVIASHGADGWRELAYGRAFPSAVDQADEVLIEHDADAEWRADVRNRLTAQVTEGWVVTLDADDELAPGFCDALRECQVDGERKLLTPRVQYVRNQRRHDPRFWPESDLKEHNWMVCGTAFPKTLFDEVGGWRTLTNTGSYNEWDDYELWIRMTQAGAVPAKVPDAVYIAHVNPKSAANRSSGVQRRAWTKEIRDMYWAT
jgi:hypothetical protein